MDEDDTVLALALACGDLIAAVSEEVKDTTITYCIGDRSVTFYGENLGALIEALVRARGAMTNWEEVGDVSQGAD